MKGLNKTNLSRENGKNICTDERDKEATSQMVFVLIAIYVL